MTFGSVLLKERKRSKIAPDEMARRLGIPNTEYMLIESGESPLEKYVELILNFSQVIDRPVSSLYYPCGLPFRDLDNYEIEVEPAG